MNGKQIGELYNHYKNSEKRKLSRSIKTDSEKIEEKGFQRRTLVKVSTLETDKLPKPVKNHSNTSDINTRKRRISIESKCKLTSSLISNNKEKNNNKNDNPSNSNIRKKGFFMISSRKDHSKLPLKSNDILNVLKIDSKNNSTKLGKIVKIDCNKFSQKTTNPLSKDFHDLLEIQKTDDSSLESDNKNFDELKFDDIEMVIHILKPEEEKKETILEKNDTLISQLTYEDIDINTPSIEEITELPFILEMFSDDHDPKKFFTQNDISFALYFWQIKKVIAKNEVLDQFYIQNSTPKMIFSTMITLSSPNHTKFCIYLPFSISYFLLNCSFPVRLCFVHALFSQLLKINCSKVDFLNFQSCYNILNFLKDGSSTPQIESPNKFLPPIRVQGKRKSSFSTQKSTFAVDCAAKVEEKDNTIDKKQKTIQLPNSKTFELGNQSSFEKSSQKLLTPLLFDNTVICKPQFLTREKEEPCSPISKFESDSISSVSFDEEEFVSKNKYIQKYSEIRHGFQRYMITIDDPVEIVNGVIKILKKEDILKILNRCLRK